MTWLYIQVNQNSVIGEKLGICVLVWVNVKGNTHGSAMGAWSKGSGMYVGGLVGDAIELLSGGTEEVGPAGV